MSTPNNADHSEPLPKPEPDRPDDALRQVVTTLNNLLSVFHADDKGEAEKIAAETDKRIMREAAAFLESPDAGISLPGIQFHATAVAEVMAMTYDMEGVDVPQEIDAVYKELTVRECLYHVHAVETELQRAAPDKALMQEHMRLALSVAKILDKGFQDLNFMKEVQTLQARIDWL